VKISFAPQKKNKTFAIKSLVFVSLCLCGDIGAFLNHQGIKRKKQLERKGLNP
jgi:hypothetical protein